MDPQTIIVVESLEDHIKISKNKPTIPFMKESINSKFGKRDPISLF
jgi:hypothetical protein